MNSDVILQRKRQIGSKWRVLRLIVNQLLFGSERKFFERGPVSKTAGIKLVLSGQDRPHFIEAGREFHVAPILQHASSAMFSRWSPAALRALGRGLRGLRGWTASRSR